MAKTRSLDIPAAPADRQSRTVTVEGNRLTLLTDGPDLLAELIALIDGAKVSLRLLYYIYQPDGSGDIVRSALLRAIERGVDVSLLVDGFGASEAPDDYFFGLTKAGAHFCRFIPNFGRRYLLRNHQKMALADYEVDGDVLYVYAILDLRRDPLWIRKRLRGAR